MGLMYYSVLTGQSPIGLSGDAYDLGDARDDNLRRALQTAVWDVVREHPYTGVNPEAARETSRTQQVPANRPRRRQSRRRPEAEVCPATVELTFGTVSIARWKDGKTAAVTIFSSDGMIRSIKSQWTPQNPDVPYDGFYRK